MRRMSRAGRHRGARPAPCFRALGALLSAQERGIDPVCGGAPGAAQRLRHGCAGRAACGRGAAAPRRRRRAQVAKREWMESVRLVFDYFCERTLRSFVELRESSVVWNYKYADVEFGRLQARARARGLR